MNSSGRKNKQSGKAMIIVVLASSIVSVGLGAGVGAVFMGRGKKAAAPTSHRKHASDESDPPALPATVHSLGDMVLNLADAGVMRYAKLTVAIGFKEKMEDDKLKELDPVLRDVVVHVVTEKQFSDLHRSGGLEKLKADLKSEFNDRLPEHAVTEVYLECFGMQ